MKIHVHFSPFSQLACFLVYFRPKHKALGSSGKHKCQFHLSVCQSREHYFVVLFLEMLWAHCRVLRGLPMSTLRFYKVNPMLSSFLLLRFISPFKRYGMKLNTFCLTWLIITAENNAFILHFQDFWPSEAKQTRFQTRKWSMAWNDVTNFAIPRPFSVTLWLGRVLKKCHFSDL